MIKVENLTKTFDGFVALDNLSLNVKKGSIYGLIGINGSGKTTIIKHMAGIFRQDSGQVTIDGRPVYDDTDIKERMGLIPDELYFFPSYTLKAMKSFYKGLYKKFDCDRYGALVKLFRLNENRRISNFSKGMQKQAAFALTMAANPDVLLLDEPIDGLDPIVRKLVLQQIVDDVAERQMTVLISSHNLKEMEGICDSIGIMKGGRMLIERDIDDLKSDIHKVQVAFPQGTPSGNEKYAGLDILHSEKRGSIELLIIKGKESEVIGRITAMNALVYDLLPLTLDEIFIYETGGEFNEID